MSDVIAYAGSFVVLEPSEITLNDPDQNGDLETYTEITVTYTPVGGSPIPWPVVSVTPIFTELTDPATGKTTRVVNSVVLLVVPEMPPPGCLGFLLPALPRFRKKRRLRPDDPVTTGGLSGTLTQGGGGGTTGGAGHVKNKSKTFNLNNPLIFYGTLA